jgi:hypothetical protein
LPQDGAHAGGQTYDSSKHRETTSNHQTTTTTTGDYEYGAGSYEGAYRRVGIVQLKQHFRSRAHTTFLEHLQQSAAGMS